MISRINKRKWNRPTFTRDGEMGQLWIIEECRKYVRPSKQWLELFYDSALTTYMNIIKSEKEYGEYAIKLAVKRAFITAKNKELGLTARGSIPGCRCLNVAEWDSYLKEYNVSNLVHKPECKGMKTLTIKNKYDSDGNNLIENMNRENTGGDYE